MRTEHVGQLCSIRATVVRTSEVRPELTVGTFICRDCSAKITNVQQQFRYTEVCVVCLRLLSLSLSLSRLLSNSFACNSQWRESLGPKRPMSFYFLSPYSATLYLVWSGEVKG